MKSQIMFLVFLLSIQTAYAQESTANAGLNVRQQSIVNIAALTAKGTDTIQLKKALINGLSNGLTVNESKEVLVHLYAYCGFPRSLNGLAMLESVLNDRKADGIEDVTGREASVLPTANKYETGKKTLEKLSGQPTKEPQTGYAAFAPIIDTFLREHLFADIFNRDVLTHAERELTTITALASMDGVARQLQSHIGLGLKVGITEAQISQLLTLVKTQVGRRQASVGKSVLAKVMAMNGNMP
jgi:4-carboxymuconolactone decarboxylase